MVEQLKDNSVSLKRIFIESELPTELTPLRELAQNLWWSWNKEAIENYPYEGGYTLEFFKSYFTRCRTDGNLPNTSMSSLFAMS